MEIHEKFLRYHREWDAWEPEDEVAAFMKGAVDKTAATCRVFDK